MRAIKETLLAIGRRGFGWGASLGVASRFSLITGAVGLSLLTVFVVAEVVARQAFNISLHWFIEYSEYLIPIIAIWGAAFTLRQDGHVNADVVLHLLPERVRQWFLLIGYILGLGFLTILSKDLFVLSLKNIASTQRSYYPSATQYGYLQLFAFIGLALFGLQLLAEIVRKARRLFGSQEGGGQGHSLAEITSNRNQNG